MPPSTPPPVTRRLRPRLVTVLFRGYLRAGTPAAGEPTRLLASTRPGHVPAGLPRIGHRHHH